MTNPVGWQYESKCKICTVTKPEVLFHKLYHLPPDNALDVVEMIEGLLRNHSTLNYQELVTVLSKLEDIVNLSVVTPNLGQALINIISDILESDSDLLPFTNTWGWGKKWIKNPTRERIFLFNICLLTGSLSSTTAS